MKSTLSAFISGILFGLGLIISEMVNPKKVQGFLDVTGYWDPTLLFVMLGALVVTAIGYRVAFSRGKPYFDISFSLPTKREIDTRLMMGAVIFGIGWGLSGLCPGPALVALSTFNLDIVIFVLAMIFGMKLFEYIG